MRGVLSGLLLAMFFSNRPALADEPSIVWRYRVLQENVALMANPLSDAVRTSFYLGRGFAAESIRPYAQSCGFSIGMQNVGSWQITTRLADWRAVGADGTYVVLHQPKTWDAEWARLGVSHAARIAFRWAQFQSENAFEPGDWIMGMVTLKEIPAPPFRLVVHYYDNQGEHGIVLEGLSCGQN